MSALDRIVVRSTGSEFVVEAEAVRIGADFLVCIHGGDKPHIGAVAAAQPRLSLADPARVSATASVLAYLGHKEDVVVKRVSEQLAAALAANVVVTAGLHWDRLTPDDLPTVMTRCDEIAVLLAARLKDLRGLPS